VPRDEFDVTKKTDDTRGAHVRPDGTVLDPDGLRIVSPELAFDGDRAVRANVIAQSPRPRARRPAGTRVNLVVGRR
jgi:hypothetical protein